MARFRGGMSPARRAEMLGRYRAGETQGALAVIYGVSLRTVGRVCAGTALVAAREARGLSQAECASALRMARSTWSDYEGGAIPDAVRGGEIEELLGVERGAIYCADHGDVSAANATPAPADVIDPAPGAAAGAAA